MMSRHLFRATAGAFVLGLLVLSVGCGPDFKARATVKGKVTFGKKHLTTGSVTFQHVQHKGYNGTATIDKHGNYELKDAPIGDVKIVVIVPKAPMGGIGKMAGNPLMKDIKSVDPNDPGRAIMGDMPSVIVPIPEKYGKIETTPLTYKVEKGEHVHDLPLTP